MWFWSVYWSTNCPVFFSFVFGRPKKNCPVSGNVWSVSDFFWSGSGFLVDQKKRLSSLREFLVDQKNQSLTKKNQRLTKNFLRLDNFFWSTKKNEKKTRQLVDQETDQNHMDGTFVNSFAF